MLNCENATRLCSESLDHKLTWRNAWSLWFHLLMCSICAGYRRDLVNLHERAIEDYEPPLVDADSRVLKLPEESKERIRKAITARE